jgi:predicted SnoaL-like aldol condensation-catalyzing enzyme
MNRNNELYIRWIDELWAGRCLAEELVSPDFVGHWPTHDVHGPEALQTFVDNTRGALKELLLVVDVGPFSDGDMVAARWIATGSNAKGPALFTGNDILRIANGKVVEYWSGMSSA